MWIGQDVAAGRGWQSGHEGIYIELGLLPVIHGDSRGSVLRLETLIAHCLDCHVDVRRSDLYALKPKNKC